MTNAAVATVAFVSRNIISRIVAEADDDPKPYVLTAEPDQIIAAVYRGHT